MTGSENERLGVVETRVESIERDVTEIKTDVKSMIKTQNELAVALAVRQASIDQQRVDRASTGVWARAFVPLIFTAVSILLTMLTTIHILTDAV